MSDIEKLTAERDELYNALRTLLESAQQGFGAFMAAVDIAEEVIHKIDKEKFTANEK